MELLDGFIAGVYEYCDRWCERCPFTSRCRSFAEAARLEASGDPALEALVKAAPRPEDVRPPLPPWVEELLDEMDRAMSQPLTREALKRLDAALPPDHQRIVECASDYAARVSGWQDARGRCRRWPPGDPRAAIAWFRTLVPAKIYRALKGLTFGDWDELDGPPDYDGSAKVALLGIEESHAAWLRLAHERRATEAEVQPMLADLVWLGQELERVFPGARDFVRPGFDEPDGVERLQAEES